MTILHLWGIIAGLFIIMLLFLNREVVMNLLGISSGNVWLWRHPNNGGGIILVKWDDLVKKNSEKYAVPETPPGREYYLEWKKRYVRFLYENEAQAGVITVKAYEPKSDEIKRTPTELFDCRDWRAAGRRYTPPPSLLEKVNMWMRIAMVGLLFFAILMIGGELGGS